MATIEPNFESICIDPNDDLVLYKKEIVRSRIEKFLYAICSLDNDDLPTPLSRIEEMYKCLVTGADFITFTPLSRAEKFVMAMLGAYDVELLPIPISRSETLMKKIATGDNNLDDVDNLQSRYEFLLAYIIKAGGFNGGSEDFYYNLTSLTSGFTTIYDTLDMPVKNTILRGQTLVNIAQQYSKFGTYTGDVNFDGEFFSYTKPTTVTSGLTFKSIYGNFEIDKQISIYVNNQSDMSLYLYDSSYKIKGTFEKGVSSVLFTTDSDSIRIGLLDNSIEANIKVSVMIFEGDCTNCEIPYFTGIQSVKMPVLTTTGKNLIDGTAGDYVGLAGEDGAMHYQVLVSDGTLKRYSHIIRCKPNTTYTLTTSGSANRCSIGEFNEYPKVGLVGTKWGNCTTGGTLTITTKPSTIYLVCYSYYSSETLSQSEMDEIVRGLVVQLEESSTATTYEPFKTNILTCNEEVTLRGIGDIKDELNLVTGKLTQRIQERVFDGSENWIIGGSGTNYIKFRCESYTDMVKSSNAITCDRYAYNKENNATSNLSVTNSTTTGKICIITSQTDLSIDNFKAKLNTDKPTIQYQLAEPIVKTVDLSTLDQDGKKTKLNTFDDITHVTVSSEGLVPTGDIDIARPIQFVDYSLDNGWVTLYNTIDYPVKNAVLRGQTLVNISSLTGVTTLKPGDVIFIENTGMKINTTYTIMFNCSNIPSTNFVEIRTMMDNTQITQVQQNVSVGYNKFTIKTNASKETNRFRFKNDTTSTTDFIFSELLILEGDWTNVDIPYFEGMTSVKMPVLTTTGKNLFDISKCKPGMTIDENGNEVTTTIATYYAYGEFIPINNEFTMSITSNNGSVPDNANGTRLRFYDEDKNLVDSQWFSPGLFKESNGRKYRTISMNGAKYLKMNFNATGSQTDTTYEAIQTIQIEQGSTATSYEPYKTNILTCNEEVELRGIGDIKDELNLTTGELTQRIGEFVLDGSSDELWDIITNGSGFKRFVSRDKKTHSNYSEITNWLPTANKSYWSLNENGFYIGTNNEPVIVFNTNDSRYNMSITEFENYLSQNPLIVQYPLIESVKTVDLSVVDQDDVLLILENGEYIITENGDYIKVGTKGGKTKLKTFDDITHVTVSSEGLIPTGEITVATKDATDVIEASVMSLRMDDILNSQSTLEESANTQSDDIDVTMLGTTDVYEQLL